MNFLNSFLYVIFSVENLTVQYRKSKITIALLQVTKTHQFRKCEYVLILGSIPLNELSYYLYSLVSAKGYSEKSLKNPQVYNSSFLFVQPYLHTKLKGLPSNYIV